MTPITDSMYGLMVRNAALYPDKAAYISDSVTFTWSQALALTESFASSLYARGFRSGTPTVLFFPRTPDAPAMLTAVRALGAPVVLLPSDADSPADVALQDRFFSGAYHIFRSHEGTWHCRHKGCTAPLVPAGRLSLPLRTEADPRDPSFLIFTSGSTGTEKGAVLTEYALINQAASQGQAAGITEDDRMMCVLPMHHVFGIIVIASSLTLSSSIFFAATRRPDYVVRSCARHRCTRMDGVPTFYMMAIEAAERLGADLSCLTGGLIAGSSYSPEQFAAIEDRLGIRLCPSYGMTEMTTTIATPQITDSRRKRSASVGKFAPGVEGVLETPEGSVIASAYKEGEICCRGVGLMLGYLTEDGQLDLPVDRGGLFHTGDLGYYDEDGDLHITGRCKDIIIRGGENLSPATIASVITSLPGVRDACVVGLEDKKYGEVPAALVVTDRYTPEELSRLLEDKLLRCQRPVRILIRDAIPQNAAGKPDKRAAKRILSEN